jgi:hypothetical protein
VIAGPAGLKLAGLFHILAAKDRSGDRFRDLQFIKAWMSRPTDGIGRNTTIPADLDLFKTAVYIFDSGIKAG